MRISPKTFWTLIATFLVLAGGIVANPWLWSADQILLIEVLVVIGWLSCEFYRAARQNKADQQVPSVQKPTEPPGPIFADISVAAWSSLATIIVLWAMMVRVRWFEPVRMPDDDRLFAESIDFRTTWLRLFEPMVDHVMVLPRLVTYLLMQFSAESSRDMAGAVASAVLFVPAMILLFLIAWREWRSEFVGLIAVALFSLTGTYREIIVWYTASCQWLITLNLFLLSLMFACDRRLRAVHVALVCLLAFVAPLNFSFGVLVGPLTAIWVAVRSHARDWKHRALVVVPILGSVAGTAILTLLWVHYGREEGFSFNVGRGMIMSARLAIDVLGLRNLGVEATLTKSWHMALIPAVVISLVVVLRLVPATWRLLPMLSMIVLGYGWTIPFRTWSDHFQLTQWTRYQLFPQLGLALFLTGVVAQCGSACPWIRGMRLTIAQGSVLLIVAGALSYLHS